MCLTYTGAITTGESYIANYPQLHVYMTLTSACLVQAITPLVERILQTDMNRFRVYATSQQQS